MSDKPHFLDVLLKDGSICQMSPKALDLMIRNERVVKFRRSEGWVQVKDIPRRNKDRGRSYSGPERRGLGRRVRDR